MAISKESREFISGLIDYYISTASSYRDLARTYGKVVGSVNDMTLGMIVGSVYSSFMRIYQDQHASPDLEDINEFNKIVQDKAPEIRKAISGAPVGAASKAGSDAVQDASLADKPDTA